MAEYHIGYLIKQVFLMNQAKLNTIFAEFDLTASQTFTLIYLFKATELVINRYIKRTSRKQWTFPIHR